MIARFVNALGIATLFLVAIGWFVFLRPVSMGGSATWIIVRGDSMLPTYQTGDLILFTAARSYAVGDVVAYRVPAGEIGAGRVVMHRIVSGDASGFVLQGDNNPAPDPWHPASSDVVGAVWLVGPQLGRPIALLHQPAIAAALAAAVMVVLVLSRRPGQPSPALPAPPGAPTPAQPLAGRTRRGTNVPLATGRRSRVRVHTQRV